ncbi:MAG TPA: TldD/PmbA family protein [Solirubrobacterales bacterium]|nr:TldD/PmbA family protein [Solirubrobacterales bacterium]
MSEDLEAAARLAVDAALAEGVHEADAWCQDSVERSVRVYEGSVESLTEAGSKGAGVRVFRDGRTGYAYGSDLSEQGLRELARAAAASAAVTEPDENAGIPRRPGAAPIADLRSPGFGDWTMERRVDLALAVERAARERDPLVTNVEDTVYSDAEARAALANSNGFCDSYEETQCYSFAYAFAGDGADRMTGMGFAVGRGPDDLDPEQVGHEAADRALALHGARQPESRRCPVVLDPFVAASFASIIGRTLSADAVQRGRSLFAGREGDEIAAASFRLVDDGVHPEGMATSPFDGEGVARQTTTLIEDGVLRTYLFDTYTANKGQRDSTGNGDRGSYRTPPSVSPSNLLVASGDASSEDLLQAAGDGLYVMGVSGLHSGVNPVSGSFSVGATGRLIRDGELAEPAREMTIASDLVAMLQGVTRAGAAARWVPFGGSVQAPALLVEEMTVAGA